MTAPLLELEQVRCSVDNTTVLDNVSFSTSSRREGLSGKTGGVSALLEGRARLLSGTVRVLGEPLEIARQQRLFGCAVRVSAVPTKWTVRHVLESAAEFAGYSRADSRKRAITALERVEQPMLLKRLWSRCSPVEQSIATLALGLVSEPALLFVSLPLGEFRLPEILRYGPALARAVAGIDYVAELRIAATLPEELTWVSALDATTHVFESGPTQSVSALRRQQVRYLLRATGDEAKALAALQNVGFSPISIHAEGDLGIGQLTYLIDVERSDDGTVDTGPVLDGVIASGLELLELTPVGSGPRVK